ncbi:hypothetical protein [Phytohabitans houttuyneae]|uniref:Uncharacterized protein n=1 Tax=Phytohabitans houttuyneae TaxID=1076126 RepID=A0A6V8K3D8_9ACTN|nr:hypothetical protein [Phytohabitans houttuyneae]GFJ78030.1 hypothetical protein Phou_022100 [Phytohabitans houttuyneae]
MSADPARAPGGAGRDAGAHVLVMSNRYDTEPGAGGTEALTADLVTALTARSLRVTWLTPAAAGQQRAGAVPRPRVPGGSGRTTRPPRWHPCWAGWPRSTLST